MGGLLVDVGHGVLIHQWCLWFSSTSGVCVMEEEHEHDHEVACDDG